MLKVTYTLFGSIAIWLALLVTGVDRLSTVSTDTPFSRTISICVACSFAWALWWTSEDSQNSASFFGITPAVGLRQWRAVKVLRGLLIVVTSYWITTMLLGAVAQYLSGAPVVRQAVIEKSSRALAAKGACVLRITLADTGRRWSGSFCLKARASTALGPDDLKVSECVAYRARQTILGEVAEKIERAEGCRN